MLFEMNSDITTLVDLTHVFSISIKGIGLGKRRARSCTSSDGDLSTINGVNPELPV